MADLRSLIEDGDRGGINPSPWQEDPTDFPTGVIDQDPTPPAPIETGGGGGPRGGGGAPTILNDRPIINIPGAPQFSYGNFKPPNPADISSDPNFQFRRDQGIQAIERGAAAKGLLRTGGTFKDLGSWVSNFSGAEAQNAYDRALRTHMANFDIEQARFRPALAYWQALANAEQAAALAQYGRHTAWDAPVHSSGGPDIPPPPDDQFDVSAF